MELSDFFGGGGAAFWTFEILNAVTFTNFEKNRYEPHILWWQPIRCVLFLLEPLLVALSLFYSLHQFDLDNMSFNLRGSWINEKDQKFQKNKICS